MPEIRESIQLLTIVVQTLTWTTEMQIEDQVQAKIASHISGEELCKMEVCTRQKMSLASLYSFVMTLMALQTQRLIT